MRKSFGWHTESLQSRLHWPCPHHPLWLHRLCVEIGDTGSWSQACPWAHRQSLFNAKKFLVDPSSLPCVGRASCSRHEISNAHSSRLSTLAVSCPLVLLCLDFPPNREMFLPCGGSCPWRTRALTFFELPASPCGGHCSKTHRWYPVSRVLSLWTEVLLWSSWPPQPLSLVQFLQPCTLCRNVF